MDPNFAAELVRRQAAFQLHQQRVASIHSLVDFVVPIILLVVAACIVIAIVRLFVACRGGGLRAYIAYVFNPAEFRERQREKIRAGFRRGRQRRGAGSRSYPGGDYQTQDVSEDKSPSPSQPLRTPLIHSSYRHCTVGLSSDV
jgi:hypothetical protein